jgi:hypothetical protein
MRVWARERAMVIGDDVRCEKWGVSESHKQSSISTIGTDQQADRQTCGSPTLFMAQSYRPEWRYLRGQRQTGRQKVDNKEGIQRENEERKTVTKDGRGGIHGGAEDGDEEGAEEGKHDHW